MGKKFKDSVEFDKYIESVCEKIKKLALEVQAWNGEGNRFAFVKKEGEINIDLCDMYDYNEAEKKDPENFHYGKLDQHYVALFMRTIFSIRWKYHGVTGKESKSNITHILYDMFTWDMGDHYSSSSKYEYDVKNRPNEFSEHKGNYLCAPWKKDARNLTIRKKDSCPYTNSVAKKAWEYMYYIGRHTSIASSEWSVSFDFTG